MQFHLVVIAATAYTAIVTKQTLNKHRCNLVARTVQKVDFLVSTSDAVKQQRLNGGLLSAAIAFRSTVPVHRKAVELHQLKTSK